MRVRLVPLGTIQRELLVRLQAELTKAYGWWGEIAAPRPVPDFAYDRQRSQYLSATLLAVLKEPEPTGEEKILGLTEVDLYVPGLNFVFGEADSEWGAAIISLKRLRQEFYGLTHDEDKLVRRMITEAVHELGHILDLAHCHNRRCVMYFSNSLKDTDNKGAQFCSRCHHQLKKEGFL
ncbi:MAG: archaemetzincin family Zn-dependent metalloprotease [Chloroflexi bacterium]|nr:archaemetzincin family Zn-dependent metalloprotease [Chloroflexota bacterium]